MGRCTWAVGKVISNNGGVKVQEEISTVDTLGRIRSGQELVIAKFYDCMF